MSFIVVSNKLNNKSYFDIKGIKIIYIIFIAYKLFYECKLTKHMLFNFLISCKFI